MNRLKNLLIGNIIMMLMLVATLASAHDLAGIVGSVPQAPIQRAFVYEGQLAVVDGSYDIQLQLYTAATGGSLVGSPSTMSFENVPVAGHQYSVRPNFGGSAFPQGLAVPSRWLQIGYRSATSTGAYTMLPLREPLVPYA